MEAYERGEGSQEQIATRFDVSIAAFRRWLKLKRTQGHVRPKPDAGPTAPKKFLEPHREAVKLWLTEQSDLTNQELSDKLFEQFEVRVNPTWIGRVVKRAGWSRKKKR